VRKTDAVINAHMTPTSCKRQPLTARHGAASGAQIKKNSSERWIYYYAKETVSHDNAQDTHADCFPYLWQMQGRLRLIFKLHMFMMLTFSQRFANTSFKHCLKRVINGGHET